ncbi:HPP family protein [Actinomadura sp. CNU-125]|uniref:HPP family protein n=1 Tax=Actinomadura sp. CNU-125 TaxID=1904961 RepID=UPI0009F96CEC|nr:HPP family protein [Actinomadura sp. CNU-125]
MADERSPSWYHVEVLERRYPANAVRAVYCGTNSFLSMAIMAGLAYATHAPFIFPSLGPTAFLLFFSPRTANASPRNTLVGHLIGMFSGYFALVVTGLTSAPPNLEHVTGDRVLAAAIALGLTCGLMPLLRAAHPPAGATTLIIALGLLRSPEDLAIMSAAVVVIVAQGLVINRIAGIPYPLWKPKPAPDA